jgi:hypothetical protein
MKSFQPMGRKMGNGRPMALSNGRNVVEMFVLS